MLKYYIITFCKGFATRQCLGDNQWDSPNVSQCITIKQRILEIRAEELVNLVDGRNLTQTFIPEAVVDIADELQEITNTTQPLPPNVVFSAANTLDSIIE